MPDQTDTFQRPLYDIEAALRTVAQHRRRRDEASAALAVIADDLAAHVARHFGPEAHETAGLSLVLASASIGSIAEMLLEANPGTPPGALGLLCNLLSYAGQRLVVDARAAAEPLEGTDA